MFFGQRIRDVAIGAIGSLIAAGLLALAGLLIGHDADGVRGSIGGAVIAAVAALAVGAATAWALAPGLVRSIPYLTRDEVDRRIALATQEIWSFQISGGEFTTHSVDSYMRWLAQDPHRKLKLLFANPDNEGLLRSIGKLSGLGPLQSNDTALQVLRETIHTSLTHYQKLASTFPGRVEVRVYDCAPPCSVHAVDPESPSRHSSFFIEQYLPGLQWHERPCLIFSSRHRLFPVHVTQCALWFKESAIPLPNR